MPKRRPDDQEFFESELLSNFSRRLEEYRARRDFSILQVAKLVGFSHAFVTNILEGRANPSLLVVQRIADRLEVSTGWLCGHVEETPPILRTAGNGTPKLS